MAQVHFLVYEFCDKIVRFLFDVLFRVFWFSKASFDALTPSFITF